MNIHSNKILKAIGFFFCMLLLNAGTFPEALPDYKKIHDYKLQNLKFNKTTLNDFQKELPDSEVYKVEEGVYILSTDPKETSTYNKVFVGFRKNRLDWIEFQFNKEIKISKIIELYGFPHNILTEYNKDFDYYLYGAFNIASNKEHTLAKNIIIYKPTNQLPEIDDIKQEKKEINKTTEAPQRKFFEVYPKLQPGITLEREFEKHFPLLLPYLDEEFSTTSTYTITEELGDARYYYKKGTIRFENGLLSWINLAPVNLYIDNLLKLANKTYKVEKLSEHNDLYNFDNYIAVVERESGQVLNIGIFQKDNLF